MEYQAKLNENTHRFYNVLQVLKVLIKIIKYNHQVFNLLLLCISFYISRYQFLQRFRTSFNIIWKKIFPMNFPLFNEFTQHAHPHAPNSENL